MCMCWSTTMLHCTLIMHAQGCYKLVIFIAHQVVYSIILLQSCTIESHIYIVRVPFLFDMILKEKLVWLRKIKAVQPWYLCMRVISTPFWVEGYNYIGMITWMHVPISIVVCLQYCLQYCSHDIDVILP